MWKTKSKYFVNIHIPIVCIVPCSSIIFLKSPTITHPLVFTSWVIPCVCSSTSCFHDWCYNLFPFNCCNFHLVSLHLIHWLVLSICKQTSNLRWDRSIFSCVCCTTSVVDASRNWNVNVLEFLLGKMKTIQIVKIRDVKMNKSIRHAIYCWGHW